MNLKPLIILLLASCATLPSAAQAPPPLNIGDRLPDTYLQHISNHPTPAAPLSTFKSKLLVLDFFASWCGACLKSIPRLDSLTRRYPGQVKALLVNPPGTGDSPQKIQAMIKKFKSGNPAFALPVVCGDTALFNFFPHKELPHYIWLNENFQVLAITGSTALTAQNIEAALAGRPLQLPRKLEDMAYDYRQPLFINNNGGTGDQTVFRSLLSSHVPGIGATAWRQVNTDKRVTRLAFTNATILHLYKQAWNVSLPPSQVLVKAADTTVLHHNEPDDEWKKLHTWCYEQVTPPAPLEQVLLRMQQDLQQVFPYTATYDTIALPAWVLYSNPMALNQKAGKEKSAYNFSSSTGGNHVTNKSINFLVSHLGRELSLPVVNETGIDYNITLSLPNDLENLDEMNRVLRPQGIYIIKKTHPVPVFIISDKK